MVWSPSGEAHAGSTGALCMLAHVAARARSWSAQGTPGQQLLRLPDKLD